MQWEDHISVAYSIEKHRPNDFIPTDPPPSFLRYELAYKANIEWVVFTCGEQNPCVFYPILT